MRQLVHVPTLVTVVMSTVNDASVTWVASIVRDPVISLVRPTASPEPAPTGGDR